MFDRENLRNQQLIEERMEYENEFISIPDIIKSGELDYYTSPNFEEYYMNNQFEWEDINMYDFEFEDYLNQLRDEQLIDEKEAEIETLNLQIDDYYAEYDPLGAQIESLNDICPYSDFLDFGAYDEYVKEYELMCDYDSYEDDYVEEINMDAAYCGNHLFGYVVDDEDVIAECDYPEGPNENIDGFIYLNSFDCIDFSIPDIELQDFYYDCPEPEYDIEEQYGEYLYDMEELHIHHLINQKLNEEKEFLDFVAENEIPDEYYLPAGIDDIILC